MNLGFHAGVCAEGGRAGRNVLALVAKRIVSVF
jgi:hypothetical protein